MRKVLNNPFISLKFRNFKIYFIGMNISLIGSWMQSIAVPWLALMITNDAFLVSLVAVAQFLPPLFFTIFAGVLVDKMDIKKLLIFTQSGMMIVATIFATLMLMGKINFSTIILLSFCTGLFGSLDAPSRQAFIYHLVDDERYIPNVVALNSMSFNVARVIGPAIAGVVIAKFGIVWCFIINSISFFAIIASLFFIKTKKKKTSVNIEQNLFSSIKNGFIYVASNKTLSSCLFILLCTALFLPHYSIT
ncbi:MAG: MFS transporter, partial [Campylobacter sp.]|nr:MFS transporter [Campylobacter sp.]